MALKLMALKLHLACGNDWREGYINTDVTTDGTKADWLVRMQDIGKLTQGHYSEILAIHCLCLLRPWEAEKFFVDAFHLLEPGGKLVMETVNLNVACRWALSPETRWEGTRALYGFGNDHTEAKAAYQPALFNWSPETLTEALTKVGFVVQVLPATTHLPSRDFRVEAVKP